MFSDPLSEPALEVEAEQDSSNALERATIERVRAMVANGELDDAITFLDDTLREDGGGLALRALRAKLDYAGGDYSSAAVRYASVAVEAEEIPALRLNEALCLLRAGRHDDAFAVLFRLLTRGIQTPRLWGYLGVALEQRGQYQDAAAAYHAGSYTAAAKRMRRRKLDSSLARDEDEPLEQSATRGIEALRGQIQRTSPPEQLATNGVTDAPHSFANLVANGAGDAEPLHAPRTLLDLTLASLLVVPEDLQWSHHSSGLVSATARADAPFYYDTRAFVARARVAEVAPPSGATKGFTKIDSGRVVLGPRQDGEVLQLLDLAGESLVVHDRYVVAFAVETGDMPVRHSAPWPLEMLQFSGAGTLVLGLPDSVLTYDVRGGDEFELRAASLVGWAGELEAIVDADVNRASGRVRFAGNGTVLLLTKSHTTTSPRTVGDRWMSPTDRRMV